jgi:hypothetical protein
METDVADVIDQWVDAARARHDCRVTYSYQAAGSREAQGVTRDLSKMGCGIRGDILPPVGTALHLMVYLWDEEAPLSVNAMVTWAVGEFFGVQFVDLHVKDYIRIRRYMWDVLNSAH